MWECRSKLGTPDPRFSVSRKLMDCEEHAQIGLHKLLVKQKGNQKVAVRQGWNWSKVFVHTYFHSHTIGLPCPNTDTLTWWVGHCTGPTLTIMIPSQQHFLPQHSIYLPVVTHWKINTNSQVPTKHEGFTWRLKLQICGPRSCQEQSISHRGISEGWIQKKIDIDSWIMLIFPESLLMAFAKDWQS